MINQIRFDSRLIHGQVASFWSNYLGVDRIIVISNEIIKDKLQVEMLKMACPASAKLSVLGVAKAKQNILENKYSKEEVLIIVNNASELFELVSQPEMKEYIKLINIGNISNSDGKTGIRRSIYIDELEYKLFMKISELGYAIDSRTIPNDESIDFIKLMQEKFSG